MHGDGLRMTTSGAERRRASRRMPSPAASMNVTPRRSITRIAGSWCTIELITGEPEMSSSPLIRKTPWSQRRRPPRR